MDSGSVSITLNDKLSLEKVCGPPRTPLIVGTIGVAGGIICGGLASIGNPAGGYFMSFFMFLSISFSILGVYSLTIYFCVHYDGLVPICQVTRLAWCLNYIPSGCIRIRTPSVTIRYTASYSQSLSTDADEENQQEELQPAAQNVPQVVRTPGRVRSKMRMKALELAQVMPSPQGAEGFSSPSPRDDTIAPESLPTDSVPILSPKLSDFSERAFASLSGIPPILSDENLNADISDQEVFLRDEQVIDPKQFTYRPDSADLGHSEHSKSFENIGKRFYRQKRRYSTSHEKSSEKKSSEKFVEVEVHSEIHSPIRRETHVEPPELSKNIKMGQSSRDELKTGDCTGHLDSAHNAGEGETCSKITSVGRIQARSTEPSGNINIVRTYSDELIVCHSTGHAESANPESAENVEKRETCSKITSVGRGRERSTEPSGNINIVRIYSDELIVCHSIGHSESSNLESAENVEKGETCKKVTSPVDQIHTESSEPSENINIAGTSGQQ